MASILKDGKLVPDPWRLLRATADGGLPALPASGDVIVPLALWRASRDEVTGHIGRIGVWLDSHEGPEQIADGLGSFGVVAVNFPGLGDGRGYTTARLLRERFGYTGELRAVGDVLRDQLYDLSRCGFNAFALRAGEDLEAAQLAFRDFSETYQASVERPLPLFRRRQAY